MSALFNPLRCHPSLSSPPAVRVEGAASFDDAGDLAVDFELSGDLAALRVPPPGPAHPADGLWQHTCLEVFAATMDGEAYREFNFSPSGSWAAYAFTRYRERQPDFAPGTPPALLALHGEGRLSLGAIIPAAALPRERPLRLGLSAVLESRNGSLSCWALAHPAPQPDFHDHRGFVLVCPGPAPSDP